MQWELIFRMEFAHGCDQVSVFEKKKPIHDF